MTRVYNNETGAEITFQVSDVGIRIMPYEYLDDYPHVLIELHDIDWPTHAGSCADCGALLKSFGTKTVDWFFEYNGRTFRLDLFRVGSNVNQNRLLRTHGEYFSGTKLKLLIATDSVESLETELAMNIENENYEHCSFLRDRIQSLKQS